PPVAIPLRWTWALPDRRRLQRDEHGGDARLGGLPGTHSLDCSSHRQLGCRASYLPARVLRDLGLSGNGWLTCRRLARTPYRRGAGRVNAPGRRARNVTKKLLTKANYLVSS